MDKGKLERMARAAMSGGLGVRKETQEGEWHFTSEGLMEFADALALAIVDDVQESVERVTKKWSAR
jgi:hypothetical protein